MIASKTEKPNRWTVAEIARRNHDAGGHYFDADTQRFFNQRRGDFRTATIGGRVFVFGRGRPWLNPESINPWSLAEFYPDTGRTHTVEAMPDAILHDPKTTAAQVRLALRAIAEPDHATPPTANGRDLEIWETVKAYTREQAAR